MKVKICGITSVADAEAAIQAGADALGFVFAESSPRFVTPEAAKEIIAALPPFVTPVGVFDDTGSDALVDVVGRTQIRCVQLHGTTGPSDLSMLRVPAIKAFRVGPGFRIDELRRYNVSAFLLDSFVEGRLGGTGTVFDWSIAEAATRYGRVIVAGGLNAENVGEAIRKVRPYAVDVSSGVESAPGRKDPAKLVAFCRAVREAERQI